MQRIQKQVRADLKQQVSVDPRTFLTSRLINSTSAEVSQLVDAELQQNPALERLEADPDPITEDEILETLLPAERLRYEQSADSVRSIPRDDSEDYWWDVVGDQPSLLDHLIAQLALEVDPELLHVAEYIVFSLDERGFLSAYEEEIALQCECTIEEVLEVIKRLQQCGPPGVGARSLQECLRLQLLASTSEHRELALQLVESHFKSLLKPPTKALARRLGVRQASLEQARDLITSLEPYPARRSKNRTQGGKSVRHRAVPDLAIKRREQGWDVLVYGMRRDVVQVSRSYKEFVDSQRGKKKDGDARHAAEMVDRAQSFISALQKRYDTYLALGQFLVAKQQGFLDTEDPKFLKPMTRSKASQEMGLHESTISRATKDKFLELPSGCLVPLELFFTPAMRVRKMVEEVLATESSDKPMSDAKVAEILKSRGVEISRRTVTKYRNRDRNLNSRHRKSA